jgi:hypothetical protein
MLSPAMEKLAASLSCVTSRGDQHTHILIEESDRLAKLKNVTLNVPNGDWFSCAPDKWRGKAAQMSPLLASGKKHKHHRACDCVVFVIKNARCIVVYLDLKSNDPDGYKGQFKSTRQFARYALGLLEEFHGEKIVIAEERYIVLWGGATMSLNKTTTAPQKGRISRSEPDKAYKREVPDNAKLYLNEFLS